MKPNGIYIPSITTFDKNDEINFKALEELIDYWIISGVSGIVVNASTGEGPYLSCEEKKTLIEFMVEKVNGRIQVFAGTGAMSTKETIRLTRDAKEAGAEAVLVTTPFFYKPSDAGIFQHFITLMDAIDTPVILYNVPKFTGYNVNPKVIAAIADECSNLVAIKDSSGNPSNMAEIIRLCGNNVSALSGSADMILPTLMLGGKGAIIAIANVIPELCVKLYNLFKKGDISKASELQHKASYANKVLVKENPQIAAIKTYLNLLNFKAGIPRKPLLKLSNKITKEIFTCMKKLNNDILI